MQLQDRFGNIAAATNGFSQDNPAPDLDSFPHLIISFMIQVMLGEGIYTLNLGATSYDLNASEIYDRVLRIASVRVMPKPGSMGLTYCPVTMAYSKYTNNAGYLS